ncbi:MAG: dihydroorotase [Clostridiales bacterium]|nr:dihydroorotase [Clostridiales bacterium]
MLYIKNGRVLDPKTGTDGVMDLIVDQGRIVAMGADLAGEGRPVSGTQMSAGDASGLTVIDADGMMVAPGLIDVHVHFRDPGFTYKEDIQSGAKAAAAGGFTTVIMMGNTRPPVDNVETLEYVIREGKKAAIHVLPCANISMGMKGQELTDMETLKAHGAVGFTDDGIPLMDAGLVKRAMDEAVRLHVPLSFHEEDRTLIANNGVNRGAVSEALGIGGSPAAAEDVLVARDCMLALHTGAVIDIQHISSGTSVRMVEFAKQLGVPVVAEVTPHHFSLDEQAVLRHGAMAKMNPPLRTAQDREEILRGLREGIIDIIATDHAPHSAEEKARPLLEAPSGIIGLETSLALGITNLVRPGILTMSQLLEKMTIHPATLYHLEEKKGWIGVGADADLVIFRPEETWTVESFQSKSSNSPFVGETLYGKVKYTICGGEIVYRG